MRFVTPSEYNASCPSAAEIIPGVSSWGEKGYFEPWLNSRNDWLYRGICAVTDKMVDTANFFKTRHLNQLKKRALNQAAREVLLAQSSDWAFLLYIGSHASYAGRRFAEHVNCAVDLLSQAIEDRVEPEMLEKSEKKDNIFPDIDFRLFASPMRY